jgi:hypothetical protein
VLLPLFYWHWRIADLPGILKVVPVLSVMWGVPTCAFCFFVFGTRTRLRIVSGFVIYAACYLCGNALGLVGSHWYWLHGTMLSFLLVTGGYLATRRAKVEDARTKWVLRGHWGVLLVFLGVTYFRAHLRTLIVFDYVLGAYFFCCALIVQRLRGVDEELTELPWYAN